MTDKIEIVKSTLQKDEFMYSIELSNANKDGILHKTIKVRGDKDPVELLAIAKRLMKDFTILPWHIPIYQKKKELMG